MASKSRRRSVLTDAERKNLMRLCSAISVDPYRTQAAIEVMLEAINPQDAEWLKTRLRLTGDNSQADRGSI